MIRTPMRLAAAALAAGCALAAAPAANATVFDHAHFTFSNQETFDDCGFPIVDDLTLTGQNVIRTVKGTQTLFFASVTVHSEEVLTNPENGKWFRVTANEINKEGGPVTQLAPGVYTYSMRENGTPIAIWDSSGRPVVADHGSIRSSITFDTGGDAQPGGTELDSHIVGVSGPHPLLDDTLFCEIANDLIG
jgi:hypothetical protein